MKIAVAADRGQVSSHFGHAPEFLIFAVDGDNVSSPTTVPNPGHGPGAGIPDFLAQQGVTCVIAGGMGQGAVDRLRERGIAAVVNARGAAEAAVRAYLRGDLKTSLSGTHDHGRHEHGGGHGEGGHGHGCGCHGHDHGVRAWRGHHMNAGSGRGCGGRGCGCGRPRRRRCARPV